MGSEKAVASGVTRQPGRSRTRRLFFFEAFRPRFSLSSMEVLSREGGYAVDAAGGEFNRLLKESADGNERAAERLLPLVYQELRALAESHLKNERPDHTLQATALVHEAYLRLVDPERVQLYNREHFFALAARAMRRILIDHARRHRTPKHGGDRGKVSLNEVPTLAGEPEVDFVALDEALDRLGEANPRCAQVTEMRYFAGMTVAEVAAVLDVSEATVERDWRVARAWLYRELTEGNGPKKGSEGCPSN